MTTSLLAAACASLLGLAQDGERAPLSVVFVGNSDTERTEQFADFLSAHFAEFDVVERTEADSAVLADFDVVVLDWAQSDPDGMSSWLEDRDAPKRTPLGERDEWDTPTVLLGSAGLNLATAWDLPGWFG